MTKPLQNFSVLLWSAVLLALFFQTETQGQDATYPVEKIYTHTDRPFYFPGETIWFKSYAVAEDNTSSTVSDVMVAELLSPKGSVVASKRFYLEYGYCYGDFQIKNDWVGGIYTLRTYTQYMRNQGEESFFTKEITVQKVVLPNLLMNLDLEREAYGKGSLVTADFLVSDLKNEPLAAKTYSAQLLIDGKPFEEKEWTTDAEGKSTLSFQLPENLKTMDVVLLVQVPYQGATESISRSVPVLLDNLDLQFLPEGGKILDGTQNTIAFKALNAFGKPADVSGILVDDQNNEIGFFESFHDGMGTFSLNPHNNRNYFAKITSPFVSDSLYALPKNYRQGAKVAVLQRDKELLQYAVFSTERFRGSVKIISAAGEVMHNQEVRINFGNQTYDVDVSKFPRGIAKIQLVAGNAEIVSERLVFLNAKKGLHILIKTNKESYQPREEITLEIKTTDDQGNAISSNLSVAVADNSLLTLADDKQDRMDSFLLMSSELQGKIHEPSFYFDPEEEDRWAALDLVMLTHGWRDYLVNPLPQSKSLAFKPERKHVVFGQVLDKEDQPIAASILVFDQNGQKVLHFDTDENGDFQFKTAQVQYAIVAAYREDRAGLKIVLNKTINQKYGGPNVDFFDVRQPKTENKLELEEPKSPFAEPLQEQASISTKLAADEASLDEVVIVGYGMYERNALAGAVRTITSRELSGVSGNFTQALKGRVAGIQVTDATPGSNPSVVIRGMSSIRGNAAPLFIIDGIPVNSGLPGDGNVNLSDMDVSQIASVTVVKGAAASALYGTRGANGVLLITTKNQNYGNHKLLFSRRFENYAVTQVYNHQDAVLSKSNKFYVPVYDSREVPKKRTDFRKTIYWNPVVQTNAWGYAMLTFYNSDDLTSFKVVAEGVSYDGKVGHEETVYNIEKPLTIGTKIPSYCTLGDTIVLPLRITNASAKSIRTKIGLDVPKNIEVLNATTIADSLTVEANSFQMVNVKVRPKALDASGRLQASVNGGGLADAFSQEIEVISPFFPVETSISGIESGEYTFSITNPVEGSLTAEFNIYVDVVGEVMDGIAGIIREPYGCFEQTSSATYPNVMVLQYLRETGKLNPEIEKKAMDFIKQGYKRLIGFETRAGGFEWFGKTPPHETLTAFGILEFTEMQKVYPKVDQKMIDRTVSWLLGQKDGEGGFHKSEKGYDSFASSPPLVANAYIVYALSEVGLNSEIDLEYKSALDEALQSRDSYRMALLALAAHNRDDFISYNQLMKLLVEQWKENDFDWKTNATITRSYRNAANRETSALVTLAALRNNTEYTEMIVKSVEFIAGSRKYGRFGNTQTTVMCLKALLEYNKTQKSKLLNDDTLQLTINGREVDVDDHKVENGILRIRNLTKFFDSGMQLVRVGFSDSENTFPFSLNVGWETHLPRSSTNLPVMLNTEMEKQTVNQGELARLKLEVKNTTNDGLGMITAIVGVPSGAAVQPYQLKELVESEKIAYYETFENYLVLYWRSLRAGETKRINLDLKTEVPGSYTAPASTAYPYYGDEFKHWITGTNLHIEN